MKVEFKVQYFPFAGVLRMIEEVLEVGTFIYI